MKLRFKYQKFQADAAKAVVDVFTGQPYQTFSYLIDQGKNSQQGTIHPSLLPTGWRNQPIVSSLTDEKILEHIQTIQRANQIEPSTELAEHGYNLTIEMETGTGKTYTYIKTMYELYKHYGWSKYIIVVPSVAIREGVYKTFEMTEDHFAEEYGERIEYFIYDSNHLDNIESFARNASIHVMIINSQAFNGNSANAKVIRTEKEGCKWRRPIDVISKTNPIVIIDEPQSVEGPSTKKRLRDFNPLMILRYSATHKNVYNMIYRLDAMDAYNKKLVKKIAVKGITATGTTATDSFVYIESVNCSKQNPTATIQMDYRTARDTIQKKTITVDEGFNLYDHSASAGKAKLDEYKHNFVVDKINGRDNSVTFSDGKKLFVGDVSGKPDEAQLRRIQIRETIISHLEREKALFSKGIKVLSLFFIDEVDKYRQYDAAGNPVNGEYATMFEEEYKDVLSTWQREFNDDEYMVYLDAIPVEKTHNGYFSIDKKGHMVNSPVSKKERANSEGAVSDDVSAYELIMKNKELLLDRDPKRSPVRFIFSHSALREGWDNPNVFQICTLKESGSDVRKRQEVGRGLRLCVNQDGERMDESILGDAVQDVNVLTVIASESYDSFAKGLQQAIADTVANRPQKVTKELFVGKEIIDSHGQKQVIDEDLAVAIMYDLISNKYINKKGELTDTYYEDKKNGVVKVAEEVADSAVAIIQILDSVYSDKAIAIDNARNNNVELQVDANKLAMPEFKALWKRINQKSVYTVTFDSEELIRNSVEVLNNKLKIAPIQYQVETGKMERIQSKEDLKNGAAFVKEVGDGYAATIQANSQVKYDLIGKLVEETGLTRKDIVTILQRIKPNVFKRFADNPEEFISQGARLINEQKATAVIQHITYDVLDERYSTTIFTDPTIKGRLNVNAMKTKKHLYDHLVFDSENEKNFATELDTCNDVAVYVKLPGDFYISTPVGKYNPDWAIAFYKGTVKHIYFVAETKGSLSSLQLREIEEAKIKCAKEHFKAISSDNVVYDVVDSYETLLKLVRA